MKSITFIFINFMVGFISDIILNDLSKVNKDIMLEDYFKNKYIFEAAVYAGLTIAIATILLTSSSNIFLNFCLPSNNNELLKFLILGYIIGYILDYIIYKYKIFDGLDNYYKKFGAGHYGAFAFIFSLIVSFIIQKNIIPYL